MSGGIDEVYKLIMLTDIKGIWKQKVKVLSEVYLKRQELQKKQRSFKRLDLSIKLFNVNKA